jgi:hypothetical protein
MIKRKIKPAYLLFLVLPLLYFFLCEKGTAPSVKKQQDYFYFSVMTSGPAVISLYTGKDSLASWELNSAGYKYLDYLGLLNDNNGITLKVNHLKAGDTISFLAFNLCRDNKIFSLYNCSEPNCRMENAGMIEKDGLQLAIVQKTGIPVNVLLQSASLWKQTNPDRWFKIIIIVLFLVTFILIIVFSPAVRYFIICCVLALLAMLLLFFIEKDFQSHITISTKAPVKKFQTFYNYNPCFTPDKMFSSEKASSIFSTQVDLQEDRCIRCDMDGSPEEIGEVNYRMNAGILYFVWDLAYIPQEKLVMNDLAIRNGKFYITGNDPHILFTSSFFTDRIHALVLARKNLFLLITLLIFLFLIAINRWTAKIRIKHFHPVYLVFLIIPLTYSFFMLGKTNNPAWKADDVLYFSIRTTGPSVVDLINGNKPIASWNINSSGYKYLQYQGPVNDSAGLIIQVRNLAEKDSISLLSVNFFRDYQTVSLYKNKEPSGPIINADIIEGTGAIDAAVQKSGTPVSICLQPINIWERTDPENKMNILIIIVFIVVFVLILVIAPPVKYFIYSCVGALCLMTAFYWIAHDINGQVAMQTDSPVKSADFFYNDNPCFNSVQKVSIYNWTCFFRTDVYLPVNKYLRCDINENIKLLKSFNVIAKTGIFKNNMDFFKISQDKMVLNDLVYRNGAFYVCGNDPYFCLTSNYFTSRVQWMVLMRENLFLFVSLLLFLIFTAVRSLAKKS